MPLRSKLLLELRASYDRMQNARIAAANSDDEETLSMLRHAERNFQTASEGLARLVPRIVAAENDDRISAR